MAEDKKSNPIVLKKAENKKEAFFTSYRHPEDPRKLITVFGDNHAGYAGSVVKAMASAKNGYKKIVELFPDAIPGSGDTAELEDFFAKIEDLLVARVHQVNRLTPTIVEVVVRAPMAARKFQPGEFYRLQSYERDAPIVQGTRLNM